MFVSIIYGGFVSAVVSAVALRCLCGASAVPLRCFCGASAVPLRCVLFFCFCGAIFVSAVFLRRHFWDQLSLRICFCGASAEGFVSAVNYLYGKL